LSATRRVVHRADKSTAGARSPTDRLSTPSPPRIRDRTMVDPGASRRADRRNRRGHDHDGPGTRRPASTGSRASRQARHPPRDREALLEVRVRQDGTGVHVRRVHRHRGGAHLLRRAGDLPGSRRRLLGLRADRPQQPGHRPDHRRRRLGRPRRRRCPARSARAGGGLPRRGLGACLRPGAGDLVGIRLCRRLQPRHEPHLRDRGGS
jgi:hypothetical protein